MQVIKLPTWLINQIDRVSRSFLWKGSDVCHGGHCLVNWEKCCLPKINGGLGILHLPSQNIALLSKWIWKLQAEEDSVWTKTIHNLYGTTNLQLLAELDCTSYGLKDALQGLHVVLASTNISDNGDSINWKWTADGAFTTKSTYMLLRDPGVRSTFQCWIWKIHAPPKTKLFCWLLLMNRLLTQENLEKRRWPSIQHRVLCNNSDKETTRHLFLHCAFARDLLESTIGNGLIIHQADEVINFWDRNKTILLNKSSLWLEAMWRIWKDRNLCIFEGKRPNAHTSIRRIIQDSILWKTYDR
ncbi:RNA-directed DNA polymerase (reverse transcriptase)-related family protein [Rhynchospora pubera]|uniref:RNA-directed DNA polymerase (Reverse transcriptase)-related family protein n=1 Tax=Rhynchospora pubera TaxID=906938 RepID=A0AAV8E502_9POAL|nr:RNA-directed DNA polymerase (reverse transcriptase)-related family protein [Rhynchospora pubera]